MRLMRAMRFNSQPQYAVSIDRGHRMGRHITAAIAASNGANALELLTGIKATYTAGGRPPLNRCNAGIGTVPGALQGLYYANDARFADGSNGKYSVEFLAVVTGTMNLFDRLLDHSNTAGGWDVEVGVGQWNFLIWNGGTPTTVRCTPNPLVTRGIYHVVCTVDGGAIVTYCNGVQMATGSGTQSTTTAPFVLHALNPAGNNAGAGTTILFTNIYNGTVLTPADAIRRYSRIWEIYRAGGRLYSNGNAAGGIATLIEDPDVFAATGLASHHGTAALTEDADTLSASGEVEHEGMIVLTEADDIMSSSGVIADFRVSPIPIALFPPKFDTTHRRALDVVKLVDPQRRPTPEYRRWMESIDLTVRRLAAGPNYVILPTSDPHVVGALWNNAGVVTISAG